MSQSKETQKIDEQLQQQLTYLNLPFIQKNYEDFATRDMRDCFDDRNPFGDA